MFQRSKKAPSDNPHAGASEHGGSGGGGLLATFGLASGLPPKAHFDLSRVEANRYELQFGDKLLRRDARSMTKAIAEDPEGTLWAMHYAAPTLRRDQAWLRKARSASAAAYTGLGEAEQRAVHFEW